MLCIATIFAFFATFAVATAAPATNSSFETLFTPGVNGTNVSIISTGIYEILRAEIYQSTVDVTTNGSDFQTIREVFTVIVQGNNSGALPVKCNGTWLSVFATYPIWAPLYCSDPAVNATLLQGEVWPEYGGFYLFVELSGVDPAAWMVGDHLSSAPGWSYGPVSNGTWPPGGYWLWSGSEIIDQLPTLSLSNWIGFNSTKP